MGATSGFTVIYDPGMSGVAVVKVINHDGQSAEM
jgi:hypothetical protein